MKTLREEFLEIRDEIIYVAKSVRDQKYIDAAYTLGSLQIKCDELSENYSLCDEGEYDDKDLEEDYKQLEMFFIKSNHVCNGRPDEFQFHQNELTQALAKFILKPYAQRKVNDYYEKNNSCMCCE